MILMSEVNALRVRPIGKCPACGGTMVIRRLECETCGTAVEGRFSRSRFDRLTPEQQEFVEVFLIARGNIKEVERVLGISYPTVRNRLESVLESMGHRIDKEPDADRRNRILSALDRGELSVAEAIKQLRGDSDE